MCVRVRVCVCVCVCVCVGGDYNERTAGADASMEAPKLYDRHELLHLHVASKFTLIDHDRC